MTTRTRYARPDAARPDADHDHDHDDPRAADSRAADSIAMPSPGDLADAVDAVRWSRFIYAHAQLACALGPHRRAVWVDERAAGEASDEACGTLDAMMVRLAKIAEHAPDKATRADARARMLLVLGSFD